MADTDLLVEPKLRRQKKVTDIPAAITSRSMINKHRSEQADIRRGSMNLKKPSKPEEREPWRRRSTSFAVSQANLANLHKRANGTMTDRSRDKSSPMTSLPSSSSYKRNVTGSNSSSSNSSLVSRSSSISSKESYFDSYWKRLQASCPQIQFGRSKSFSSNGHQQEMDLSYLEPYSGCGLFSTSGVTGNKARMSSADSLLRYGSVQDISGIGKNQVTFASSRYTLRRSSSLVDLNADVNISLTKAVREQLKQSTIVKRIQNPSASQRNSTTPRSEKKTEKKSASIRQATIKNSDKVSAKNNSTASIKRPVTRETEKVVQDSEKVNKPRRRAIRTQMTEDGEGEFEVVEYL